MSLEPCPFCGKPFKRLKSHLPHCKKAPASKATKSSKTPKASLPVTPKGTTLTDSDKDIVNFLDKKLNDSFSQAKTKSNRKVEKESMDKVAVEEVLLAEGSNTDTGRPHNKWLTKREQEIAKQAALLTQKGSKFTSVSQQEKHNCQSESAQHHIKGIPQTRRKDAQGQNQKALEGITVPSLVTACKFDITAPDLLQVPWIAGSQAEQSMCKSKASANILEEIQNSQKALSKDFALAARGTEQAHFSFFQTKTCVWDHIKHGLYDRRSGVVPVLYSIGATPEVSISKFGNISVSILKPHLEKQNASFAPLLACGQTSIQRPFDGMCPSTLQSMAVMEGTLEMGIGCGVKLVSAFQSKIASNDGLRTKSQSPKPSPQSQDSSTEQRLGDVRIHKLAAWLGTRTPKSPKEAITMLNRGWQWYYRKYINVQKGGIGGIAMLIAGYCVLSYMWSYPHLKKERWRKYH